MKEQKKTTKRNIKKRERNKEKRSTTEKKV